MHDLSKIRSYPGVFDEALRRRGLQPLTSKIQEIDVRHRGLQKRLQALRHERRRLSQEIGRVSGQDEGSISEMRERGTAIRREIGLVEEEVRGLEEALTVLILECPNVVAEDVPDGIDECSNEVVRSVGVPWVGGGLGHVELGEGLGLLDFSTAAVMSGARFTVLYGVLARLERALGQFMIDLHTQEHGYTEVSTPFLVREGALVGTGQLPKFAEEQFQTTSGYWLIPTAEVTLTNLVAGRILEEERLPLRYTALTPCFRAEAGAAGRDTRGMLRQHQFWKVELVSVCTPECSCEEHERMVVCAEAVLRRLGIPFRTVILCSGDMGFAARKTYDIEVWLPGQQRYREVSSCSDCGDFQARRMKSRYRPRGEKKTAFVHTLNGSGVAVGRCLIALLENYQRSDGCITIPEVLVPYMNGLESIGFG